MGLGSTGHMFWLTGCCTHPYPPASVSLSIREGSDYWGLDQSPKLSWALEMMVDLGFPDGGSLCTPLPSTLAPPTPSRRRQTLQGSLDELRSAD